jgi:hypothetical protein
VVELTYVVYERRRIYTRNVQPMMSIAGVGGPRGAVCTCRNRKSAEKRNEELLRFFIFENERGFLVIFDTEKAQ